MTTTPDPEILARLAAFVARCRRRLDAEKPIPLPPDDAPPPPKPHSETDKEREP